MLLSKHESNKSCSKVYSTTTNQKELKVSLFSKNNAGEHVEINQDDYSMLSLPARDGRWDESTLPLEPAEYSLLKSPTKSMVIESPTTKFCDFNSPLKVVEKVSSDLASSESDENSSPLIIMKVQTSKWKDEEFIPVYEEEVPT